VLLARGVFGTRLGVMASPTTTGLAVSAVGATWTDNLPTTGWYSSIVVDTYYAPSLSSDGNTNTFIQCADSTLAQFFTVGLNINTGGGWFAGTKGSGATTFISATANTVGYGATPNTKIHSGLVHLGLNYAGGAGGTVTFYINGISVGTSTMTQTLAFTKPTALGPAQARFGMLRYTNASQTAAQAKARAMADLSL
jgi:hypothetical protein